MEKYPKIFKKSEKAMEFLRQYDTAFIFGSRFIYGIRNISPVIIGMAEIPPAKFIVLNILAAIVWSVSIVGIGYLFADALNLAKDNVQILQIIGLIVLVVVAIIFVRKKTKKKR